MFTYNVPQRKFVYPALTLLLLLLFMMRYALAVDSVVPTPTPNKAGSDVVNSMNAARNANASARSSVDSANRAMNASDRAMNATDNAVRNADSAVRRAGAAVENSASNFARDVRTGAERGMDRVDRALTSSDNAMRNAASDSTMRDASRNWTAGMQNERDALESQAERNIDNIRARYQTQNDWIDSYNNAYNQDPIILQDQVSKAMGMPQSISERELSAAREADIKHNEARLKLDDQRAKQQRDYREKRNDIEERMSKAESGSREYERLQSQLTDLDKNYAESEQKFKEDFRNIDARFSTNR